MDLQKGMIVTNRGGNYWCQYISPGDANGAIIFDGNFQLYVPADNLSATPLPIGLTALGFISLSGSSDHPNWTYYRNGNMEIIEKENGDFFIDDKAIKFTLEAQEAFELFELLIKPDKTV